VGPKPLGKVGGWGERERHALCPPPVLTVTQDEYEDLESIHKEEKLQLEELRQQHVVLVEEFAQIWTEREINSKKRMEAEREMLRMVRAATLIQAVWKGYLVRSMLKSKRKKKKRGKGKGKAKGKVRK
jgi:hypothetical protein